MTEKFVKYDKDKGMYDLIPPLAEESVVDVLTYGAKKYSPNNWRNVDDLNRYVAACMRHLSAYRQGEKIDTESAHPHLAHAICCLMFILQLDREKEKYFGQKEKINLYYRQVKV